LIEMAITQLTEKEYKDLLTYRGCTKEEIVDVVERTFKKRK